jgi:hypothetical protein
LVNSGHYELKTVKVKTGLVTGGSERIAFSIVRVDVRYLDGIEGIVLQYDSINRIYLCIYAMSLEIYVKILVLYLIRKDLSTTVPVVYTKLQNTIRRC